MTTLAFVDTETTGLDPDRHEVWEAGLILRYEDDTEVEYCWQLPVDLGKADAVALTIGRYYERWNGFDNGRTAVKYGGHSGKYERLGVGAEGIAGFAAMFALLTHGAHLVGAVPSFDDAFLKRLLRANGACPGWHYHLIDVEALAAGWLARHSLLDHTEDFDARPPWNSNDLSRAVGVDPDEFDRHTALGDARWAKAIYDAVMA